MAPTSLSNTCTVFHNLHMLCICIWMSTHFITASLAEQAFGICLDFGSNSQGANKSEVLLLRLYTHPRRLPLHCQSHVRCFTTFICCGWTYGHESYHVIVSINSQALGSCQEFWFWVPPDGLTTAYYYCCWGCRPTQDDSHFIVKHIIMIIRVFTTFICCGCPHGWVLITLLLVLLAKPFEVT